MRASVGAPSALLLTTSLTRHSIVKFSPLLDDLKL